MLTLNIEISNNYLTEIYKTLYTNLKLSNESYNNILSIVGEYRNLGVECLGITQLLLKHSVKYNNEKIIKKILLLSKTNKNAKTALFADNGRIIFDNYIVLKLFISECLCGNYEFYDYIVNNSYIAKNRLINIVKIINDCSKTEQELKIASNLLQDICNKIGDFEILKDIHCEKICGIDFRNVIDYREEVKQMLKNIIERGTEHE